MKKLFSFLLIFLTIGSINLFAQKSEQPKSRFFIENKGQWDNQVQYLARLNGLNLWVTNSGVVYDYYRLERDERMQLESGEPNHHAGEVKRMWGHVINSLFLGTNEHFTTQVFDKSEAYYNYFIGNDESKWASFVPLYGSVQLNDIYNGIDVRYYYDNNLVRYDWIVRPGGDPTKIRIKFEGQDGLRVSPNGDLVLQTSLGEVEHSKLLAYQMQNGVQNVIECKFKDEGNGIVSFEMGSFNPNQDLIIDPLVYSTFLGGTSSEYGYSIAADAMSNAYITGYTSSSNFPTTSGAYDQTWNSTDVFVTKMDPTGSYLVFSSFLGGTSFEYGYGIGVDGSSNVYVTGYTGSSNFPTTSGCWDNTYNSYEVFVTKFNSTGSSLSYSTFLGGTSTDYGYAIAVDGSGYAYITGYTSSSDFPTTSGCWDATYNSTDAFVTKMNQNGTGLVYSTFLGGTSSDYGYGIAVDGSGYAYVTGYTSSSNFPTTSGCWDNTYNSTDAFVTKMNQNGTGLVYSTFLGGTSSDYGYAIAVDANGCAFVTGYTSSSNFPTTAGAWDNIYNSTDAFVTKFNLTGSGLVYSTFLGGTSSEYGRGIALDDIGNAIVAGYTNSSNFPVTFDAFDNTANGGYDIFFTIFNSDGSFLDYSTYLGGASTDYGYYNSCLAYGGNNAIVTGYTSSSNFPTTVGAWDIIYNGGDVIVAKFDVGPPRTITIESVSAAQFCPGEDITVSFSITGIYLLGNVFTVQLSDQNGSFTKPIIIGTLSSVDAGTINCTIPIDIPSGMFYKIRIVSSKPAITSPDNGYDLTVMPFPSSYKIIGSGAYCEGDLKGAEIKLESSEAGTKYQVYLDGEKYGFPIVGTGKELSLGYYKTEGLYTIEGTTPFGCTRFLSSQINVKKVAIPEVYSMTGGSKVYNEAGDGTYCDGELGVAIGLNGSQDGVKYQLKLNGRNIGVPILATNQEISFGFFTDEGTYTVEGITILAGCPKMMNGSITVKKVLAPTVYSLNSVGTFCESEGGAEITLSGSQSGIIYQLQLNGKDIGKPVDGTGSSISFGKYNIEGIYTAIAQSTSHGCLTQMQGEVSLRKIPKPKVYELASRDYFCAGSDGTELILNNSDIGVLYQLMLDGNPIGAPIPGTGKMLNLGKHNVTGTYTVEAITVEGNCTNEMKGSIKLREIPSPEIQITGNMTPDFGSTENYEDAKAAEGDHYEWTVFGGKIIGSNTTISIKVEWGNNKAGLLKVNKTSSYGCTVSKEYNINLVNNVQPAFEVERTTGVAPFEAKFTDKSTGYITYRNWDFGDGKMSPQKNPTHLYTVPGKYTVKLTVGYDDVFLTETKSDFITVESSTGVNEEILSLNNGLSLYSVEPNPSNDVIRLAYSISNSQNITIAIYNILGERVLSTSDGYQIEGMHNKEINISHLPSGVYFLQILGDTGQVNRMINILK